MDFYLRQNFNCKKGPSLLAIKMGLDKCDIIILAKYEKNI
jgi:hypothetical protein